MADAQILTNTWKPKNKSSVETAVSSSHLAHYFRTTHSNEFLLLAAKAYHVAIYGQFFKVLIAPYKLVSYGFEPEVVIARRKCKSVIVNCIVTMIATELRKNCIKRILFPLLLTLQTIKNRVVGERRHNGGIAFLTFHKGETGVEVPFYKSIIGNFMVCRDRLGNIYIAAIRTPRKFRTVFYNFCCYF